MIPKSVTCGCGCTFYTDSNNNLYADCPACGFRIYFEV